MHPEQKEIDIESGKVPKQCVNVQPGEGGENSRIWQEQNNQWYKQNQGSVQVRSEIR